MSQFGQQAPYPQQPFGQQPYAAPPQGFVPQQPYAAPTAQGFAPPHGYAAPAQQAVAAGYAGAGPQLFCRVCGCGPAAKVTFRGHQGLIVMMRFLSFKGPLCRDCGMSVYREMTAKTLVQGWYGYASFLITPITVLINLVLRGRVANLPAPQPNPYGPSGRPRDPGTPLYTRPMALLGLLIPVGLLTLLILVLVLTG